MTHLRDIERDVTIAIKVLIAVIVALVILIAVTGCDRFTSRALDERQIVMDCNMTAPDGTVMRCKHDLIKEIDESGDEINVRHPAAM